MSSDDFILNNDPWNNKTLETLKSPPLKIEHLPTTDALLPSNSSALSLEKLSKLKRKLFTELCHVSSTSNTSRVNEIISTYESECLSHLGSTTDKQLAIGRFVDELDPDGSAPLHYAACFGKKDICFLLLSLGASVDVKDKHGWTPLVWATNNGHDAIVKLLIERGAKTDSKLSDGFGKSQLSVGEFLSHTIPSDPSVQNTLDAIGIRSSNNSSRGQTNVGYYKAGYDVHGLVEEELNSHLFGTERSSFLFGVAGGKSSNRYFVDRESGDEDDDEDENSYADTAKDGSIAQEGKKMYAETSSETSPSTRSFDWDRCLPDEMFVFDLRQVPIIIDSLVTELKIPHMTKSSLSAKLASANSIFLASRYAHYYGGKDLLDNLLSNFFTSFSNILKTKRGDMCTMAFWLANISQLLYYFKRDPGLLTSTGTFQVQLCEFIGDIYSALVDDGEARLERITIAGICDYESIPGGDQIVFDSKRTTLNSRPDSPEKSFFGSVFGFKSSKQSQQIIDNHPSYPEPKQTSPKRTNPSSNFGLFSFPTQSKNKNAADPTSPKSITTILSSTLFVLQSYQNHPSFQGQFIRQMVYFISCNVFNAILTHRKYCSRWKGMQIRMNMSVLEDWIRTYSNTKNLKEMSKRRKIKANDPQKPSNHILEDLLYPIPVKPVDYYIKWLQPAVIACQLLQIASTSFCERAIENESDELKIFKDTLESFSLDNVPPSPTKEPLTRSVSVLEWNSLNTDSLSYSQLHRLLVINYCYEKSEPSISPRVISFLEENRFRKLAPGETTPTISRSGTSNNLSDEITDDKQLSVGQSTLYKDVRYRLAFQLHLLPADAIKQEDILAPGEWLDPTEEWERRERQRKNEIEREGEENWWEKRFKIDVPEWLMKLVE